MLSLNGIKNILSNKCYSHWFRNDRRKCRNASKMTKRERNIIIKWLPKPAGDIRRSQVILKKGKAGLWFAQRCVWLIGGLLMTGHERDIPRWWDWSSLLSLTEQLPSQMCGDVEAWTLSVVSVLVEVRPMRSDNVNVGWERNAKNVTSIKVLVCGWQIIADWRSSKAH